MFHYFVSLQNDTHLSVISCVCMYLNWRKKPLLFMHVFACIFAKQKATTNLYLKQATLNVHNKR